MWVFMKSSEKMEDKKNHRLDLIDDTLSALDLLPKGVESTDLLKKQFNHLREMMRKQSITDKKNDGLDQALSTLQKLNARLQKADLAESSGIVKELSKNYKACQQAVEHPTQNYVIDRKNSWVDVNTKDVVLDKWVTLNSNNTINLCDMKDSSIVVKLPNLTKQVAITPSGTVITVGNSLRVSSIEKIEDKYQLVKKHKLDFDKNIKNPGTHVHEFPTIEVNDDETMVFFDTENHHTYCWQQGSNKLIPIPVDNVLAVNPVLLTDNSLALKVQDEKGNSGIAFYHFAIQKESQTATTTLINSFYPEGRIWSMGFSPDRSLLYVTVNPTTTVYRFDINTMTVKSKEVLKSISDCDRAMWRGNTLIYHDGNELKACDFSVGAPYQSTIIYSFPPESSGNQDFSILPSGDIAALYDTVSDIDESKLNIVVCEISSKVDAKLTEQTLKAINDTDILLPNINSFIADYAVHGFMRSQTPAQTLENIKTMAQVKLEKKSL